MSRTLPVIWQVSIVLYSFSIPWSSGFIFIAPSNSLSNNWVIGTGATTCTEILLPLEKKDNKHQSFSKEQSWKITTDGEGSYY